MKSILVQVMVWFRLTLTYSLNQYWLRSFTQYDVPRPPWINSLRPRQNGRHFPDDTFKRIFLYENVRISIKISMKFVPKGPTNNCPSLVQTMAWRRPGDKPLSEPMMVRLLTDICVTRPQWVKYKWMFIISVREPGVQYGQAEFTRYH